MYSVILATMMTAGGAAETWHHCHRSACYSCYSCSSCSSCYSCYSCYSGYGGYSGYSGYAGYSGYSGYAGGCYGCSTCYSSCYHCHGRVFSHFGHLNTMCSCACNSCYGGCSYYGGCCYSSCCYSSCAVYSTMPYSTVPNVIPVPPATPPGAPPGASGLRQDLQQLRDQFRPADVAPVPFNGQVLNTVKVSRVTVVLPSDARLWVDNVECPLVSAERSFDTPALDPNHVYAYNFRMEVIRDGRAVSQTQRAVIVPGQAVRVDFNRVEAVVAR